MSTSAEKNEVIERLENVQLDNNSEYEDVEAYSDSSDDSDFDEGNNSTSNTASPTNGNKISKPLEKEDIVTKYADKIKTEPFKKGPQVNKDRANRATVEQVLDPRTIRFLGKIFNSNIISRINGCISTGKEANIYHGTNDSIPNSPEYAVKIYKTSILVFKDRKRYVDGDFRLRNTKDQGNPRKMVKIWAEKEFRNLNRIYYQSKIPCPKPIILKSHVLVMEYLTKGSNQPSPKLKDYKFKNTDDIIKYYYQMLICMRRLFQDCKLVHADLSEYNSIVHDNKLFIIDVSQSVEPDHPMALDFLRMDIKNVNDFFSRSGINVYPEKSIFKFITDKDNQLGFTAKWNNAENKTELKSFEEDQEITDDGEKDTNIEISEAKTDNDEDEDTKEMRTYLDNLPLKLTKDQEIEDEIFRSLHLVRSLNHLDERDFKKFSEGQVDTMKELVAPTSTGNNNGDQNGENEAVEGVEKENIIDEEGDVDSEEDDDEEDSDEDEDSSDDEREQSTPKGKKFEDKESKKARKEAAKLAKQEKRKTKMKKHIKKKIINKRKTGK
ncbi:rio1 [Candida jiufengensis]|uniref:rio1 n=1 Tax=Candida jiufengensis TaxID=497108 RepID=UPI0022253F88|nr:rio1 [Candida jiufengensis]KAI5951184.1 rio1 [Candida jiufengensis]